MVLPPTISPRAVLLALIVFCTAPARTPGTGCRIRPTNCKGWNAQEIRNEWVTLTIVPEFGGRLMQVAFGPHEYLFVNKRYEGKYLPPREPDAPAKWHNYGGDKIWPLPEGRQGEDHWSGPLDDASQHHSRGVAVWGSRVYMNTHNAHLLCLDARSGHLVWDIAYADWNKNYGATSAPLVVKGKVIVGTSGGDDGVRGFVAVYNAITGKLAWRFWTLPGPGEFGSESWPGDSYLRGGGTTWIPGTYDPELNTLYWGTSNPSPDFNRETRPGEDLYTSSLVALDPDTGKLKWHFQFTPHDLYDCDATETAVLVDADYKGKPRKLILEANRNGFVFVLDRVTGEFLSATRFVENLNWAKGIDEKGRPILDENSARPTAKGSVVCPGFAGATDWFSPSHDLAERSLYFLALEACSVYSTGEQKFKEGETYYSTGVRHAPGQHGQKILLAYELDTGTFRWQYPQAAGRGSAAGTMSTASGLVFFGDTAETFEAVDAKTGRPLWHFNTGQFLHASPMTYAVNGKQYVAIAAGSDVFSFFALIMRVRRPERQGNNLGGAIRKGENHDAHFNDAPRFCRAPGHVPPWPWIREARGCNSTARTGAERSPETGCSRQALRQEGFHHSFDHS